MTDLFDPLDPRPHWRPDTIFDAVRYLIADRRLRRLAARHHREMLAAFEREAQRSDRNLGLFNTTGLRAFNLGDTKPNTPQRRKPGRHRRPNSHASGRRARDLCR